jgi:ParB family transcriptional regulator, chromosome partitioning protein
MAKPTKLGGLRDSFQGAREYQQIEGLQSQVENLSSDKSQLEQQIQELTDKLASQSGVHEILLSKIDRDIDQPRTVFPPALIQERSESLRAKGQLTPIIVIPSGNRYKLFEGELRWRSAQKLGWKKLQAVFLTSKESLDDTEIFERQLVTSIQSQRLHDLDIAEAIIKLAVDRYPNLVGQKAEIPKILHTALRRMERDHLLPDFNTLKIADSNTQQAWIDNLENIDEEKQIFQVILGLQLHPASISKHVLPLLKVADDVKAAIREFGIEGSKAKQIDRLTAKQLGESDQYAQKARADAIQSIVQGKFSLSEAKNLVDGTIISHTNSTSVAKPNRVSQVAGKVNQLLANIESVEELADLESALKEIQKALKLKRNELR